MLKVEEILALIDWKQRRTTGGLRSRPKKVENIQCVVDGKIRNKMCCNFCKSHNRCKDWVKKHRTLEDSKK